MIDTIIFDFGDVLEKIDYISLAAEYTGDRISAKKLFDSAVLTEHWRLYDAGINTQAQLIELLKAELDRSMHTALEQFVTNIHRACTPYTEMYDVVKDLKQRGKKIYLLSNFPEGVFERVAEPNRTLDFFDGLIVSYKLKMAKPEKQIFEYVLNEYNLKAENCLFVDDTLKNIEVAKSLGFNTHHFTTAENFKNSMCNFEL